MPSMNHLRSAPSTKNAKILMDGLILGKPTLFKGATFLVNTRLQWLALMDPDYGPRPDLVTVQLLGTGDDLVSPGDNVDYSVDLFGAVRCGSGDRRYCRYPRSG